MRVDMSKTSAEDENLYHRVAAALRRGKAAEQRLLLEKCEAEKIMDQLYMTLTRAINTVSSAKISIGIFLPALSRYFATLTSLTAFTRASELLAILRSASGAVPRENIATLLKLLVESSPILNATKLRDELVKKELVEYHCQMLGQQTYHSTAPIIELCIYSTLAMEVSYAPHPRKEHWAAIEAIWEHCVGGNEAAAQSPTLQFASLLLHSILAAQRQAMGYLEEAKISDERAIVARHAITKAKLLEAMVDELEKLKNRGNSVHNYVSYPYLLFCLLLPNLPALFTRLRRKTWPILTSFLVEASKQFDRVDWLRAHLAQALPLCDVEVGNMFHEEMHHHEMEAPQVLSGLSKATGHIEGSEKWNAIEEIMHSISTKRLVSIANCLITQEPESNCSEAKLASSLWSEALERGVDILELLRHFAQKRKDFSMGFSSQLAKLMIAEKGLRTKSLQLATVMLMMHRGDAIVLSSLVSFTLALFQPTAPREMGTLLPAEGKGVEASTEMVHAYAMAKADFLVIALRCTPQVMRSLSALICSLLPDFFQLLSLYKAEGPGSPLDKFRAEQLEHALVKLCKELEKEKSTFHKQIPFVVSNSLTGERELNLPIFILLSMCDDHDMAVIATNLPPKEKRVYGMLQAQFYAANKIVG